MRVRCAWTRVWGQWESGCVVCWSRCDLYSAGVVSCKLSPLIVSQGGLQSDFGRAGSAGTLLGMKVGPCCSVLHSMWGLHSLLLGVVVVVVVLVTKLLLVPNGCYILSR